MNLLFGNNEVRFTNGDNIQQALNGGVYFLRCDNMGPYLAVSEPFKDSDSIFGSNITSNIARCIETFESVDGNIGFAFTGQSGTGKSLSMRLLAKRVQEKYGMPIIIIDRAFDGSFLNENIPNFSNNAILIFDEFEKVYNDKDTANSLLGFFDGLNNTSRHMILVTANEGFKSDYFRNRPSRIYYQFVFGKMTEDEVVDYLDKNLNNDTYREKILLMRNLSEVFNFDMLRAIVSELNKYESLPFAEVISPLPFDIVFSEFIKFDFGVFIDNSLIGSSYMSVNVVNVMSAKDSEVYDDVSLSVDLSLTAKEAATILLKDNLIGVIPYYTSNTISSDTIQKLKELHPDKEYSYDISDHPEVAGYPFYKPCDDDCKFDREPFYMNLDEVAFTKSFNVEEFIVPISEDGKSYIKFRRRKDFNAMQRLLA